MTCRADPSRVLNLLWHPAGLTSKATTFSASRQAESSNFIGSRLALYCSVDHDKSGSAVPSWPLGSYWQWQQLHGPYMPEAPPSASTSSIGRQPRRNAGVPAVSSLRGPAVDPGAEGPSSIGPTASHKDHQCSPLASLLRHKGGHIASMQDSRGLWSHGPNPVA